VRIPAWRGFLAGGLVATAVYLQDLADLADLAGGLS
jgi:hypothetical protein